MKYLCLLVFLALGGCATNIVVKGSLPSPLIARAPVKVGVYYSPDFKNYKYHEVIKKGQTYNIDFGEQNYVFFRVLLSAMFKSVVPVGQPPLSPAKAQGLDGIIVPQIVKYGFLTPGISGLNFFSASITYRITLYTPKGKKLHDWTLVGYGKSEGGMFGGDKRALTAATLQAIRDGGARIAIDIPKDPAFVAWVRQSTQVSTAQSGDAAAQQGGRQ